MSRGLHICIAIVKELVELPFKSLCMQCLTLFIYIPAVCGEVGGGRRMFSGHFFPWHVPLTPFL